jgi:endonuclease YncB( thermonuclease family)
MKRLLIVLLMASLTLVADGIRHGETHQDPCHRLHSCPSDHQTYICGDKGRCDQCPDNEYCLQGKPRAAVQQPTRPTPAPPAQSSTVLVKRVIDGDTIELSTGEKVRLIGVDTPETKDPRKPVQYFGKEATAFTQWLAEGKPVRLEYDQQRYDKYGRILAYVYLEDGRLVNAEIIKQRYGFAYTRFPFTYLEEFRQFEREAREAKRGLWGER